jgi:hypothetical protein
MIQEFLERVNPKQKKHFTELRSTLMALPEIEETLEIDEIRGDWCPTYRVRGSDLVWVHFGNRMWLSFPIEPNFEKKVIQNENLDEDVVDKIKEAEEVGGEKWANLDIRSGEEVEAVIPLLQFRHAVLMR